MFLFHYSLHEDDFKDLPFGIERDAFLKRSWDGLSDGEKAEFNKRAKLPKPSLDDDRSGVAKRALNASINRLKKEVCSSIYY